MATLNQPDPKKAARKAPHLPGPPDIRSGKGEKEPVYADSIDELGERLSLPGEMEKSRGRGWIRNTILGVWGLGVTLGLMRMAFTGDDSMLREVFQYMGYFLVAIMSYYFGEKSHDLTDKIKRRTQRQETPS